MILIEQRMNEMAAKTVTKNEIITSPSKISKGSHIITHFRAFFMLEVGHHFPAIVLLFSSEGVTSSNDLIKSSIIVHQGIFFLPQRSRSMISSSSSSSSSSEINKKREIFLQRKKLNEGCSLRILAIW
jgi:hypothetical protein